MNLLNTQKRNFGFTAGHFMLIAGCIVLLLAFGFIKGDVSFSKLANLTLINADEKEDTISYEAIRAQVEAQVKAESGNDVAAEEAAQQRQLEELALIDPTVAAGSVLGASTDSLPSVDELMTESNFNKIAVKATLATTRATVDQYATQIHFLESYYNTTSLMAALGSHNEALLKSVPERYNGLVAALGEMEIPDKLAEYHKGKILYYSTLLVLAQSISGDGTNVDQAATAEVIFFGITDKLNSLSADVLNQYGVQL